MSLARGGSGSGRGVGVVSDKPQSVPLSFPVTATGDAASGRVKKPLRLKREDHAHVKHDDCFSEWKVRIFWVSRGVSFFQAHLRTFSLWSGNGDGKGCLVGSALGNDLRAA